MKKTLLLLALLLTSWVVAIAQPTNEKRVFPTPSNMENSEGQYLIQTADGGYLLTGTTANYSTGNYAIPRLIKLTADLQTEWDNSDLIPAAPADGLTASFYSPALQTADGGYAMAVRNDSTTTDFLRLDASGNVLWGKDLVPYASHLQLLGVLPDGGFLVSIKTNPYTLIRLDANGNIVTQKIIISQYIFNGYISSILLANNDVLTAYRSANNKIMFLRTDVDGNVIWQSPPFPGLGTVGIDDGSQMVALSDGGFALLGSSNNQPRVFRFDGLGNLVSQTVDNVFPTTIVPSSLAITADGRYVVSGKTFANRGFVAQLNAAADAIEWSAESPEDGQEHLAGLRAIPTADGWAAGVGKTTGNKFGFMKVGVNSGIIVNVLSGRVAKDDNDNCGVDAAESGLYQARVKATNGQETFGAFTNANGDYEMILPSGTFTISCSAYEPFFDLCPTANLTVSFPAGVSGSDTRDLPMKSQVLTHEISGTLHLDQNDNCTYDTDEPTLANWHVNVHYALGDINLKTNADGFYKIFVPDGAYLVWPTPYNNNFGICAPANQSVTLVGPDPQTATLDFVVQPAFLCARMRTDLSANLRPCFTRTLKAFYRNDGTVPAEDASLVVTLDPLLSYQGASPAPNLVVGQTLTFNLGDVPASPGGYWGTINIDVTPDCSLQVGEQVCASAMVFPDEDCTQAPNWNGAIVAVSGECTDDDEAVFIIKNVGTAPNAQMLEYIITEDQIVLRQGMFQLNPGEEKRDTVPANGLPLAIIAQQEPGYPGDTSVVWNIVNCGGSSGGMSSGFGGSAGPFTHQECFELTNAADPNDKNAIPEGHGPDHFVHPGTPLEYHIRFQNTGNDTAFLVVIRDTLSQHFNFAKIEPRGSSHPYEFAQIGDSIIQFTFKNIQLPDTSTNLAASEGFVDFTIYPKDGLLDGTEVLNSAAIYFDFNEPVITNTVKRIYGKYLVVTSKTSEGSNDLPVKVYPNPFITQTTFEIPENAPTGDYHLQLLDGTGRILRTVLFSGNKCLLQRESLPAGMLAWNISTNGKVVASGALVAPR